MSEETEVKNRTVEVEPQPQTEEDRYRHFLTTLNWLERLLLFMSKTELYILQFCTRSTKMTLTSVGAMVCITGILAFFSSLFAIKNSFFKGETWQTTPLAVIVPVFVAIIYAGAIMAFDREIVSATDKKAAWIRLLFAGLIGFVIAYPIELQLQMGRISAELKTIAEARNKDKTTEMKKIRDTNDLLIEEALTPLKNKQVSLTKLRDQEQKSADWESQPANGLCRGKCAEHKANAEAYQKQLDEITVKIQEERKRVENDPSYKSNVASVKEIETAKTADVNSSFDLLSQTVALHNIYKSPDYGSSAKLIGLFLKAFFICFELMPVLIKMFMPYTEYHAYLDARMRLNVNKIVGVANHRMREFRDNPDRIELNKTEISDAMAELMEDREIDINKPEDQTHA
jgi:hypothetical protein